MARLLCIAMLLAITAAPSLPLVAQSPASTPAVGPAALGEPAPELSVDQWMHRGPVKLADGRGKNFYVIYTFATWWPLARASVPQMNEIARRYAEAGVIVVGVAAEPAAKIKRFVDRAGSSLEFAVACDRGQRTLRALSAKYPGDDKCWTYVVDKNGAVVWHGSPAGRLNRVVGLLAEGKFDLEQERRLAALRQAMSVAQGKKDNDRLFSLIDQHLAIDPADVSMLRNKFVLLVEIKKDKPRALECGRRFVEVSDDAATLNALAWQMMADARWECCRDADLIMAAAEKANRISQGQVWQILNTYARAMFELRNDKTRAAEIQKTAIELCRKDPTGEMSMPELESRLARYEGRATTQTSGD